MFPTELLVFLSQQLASDRALRAAAVATSPATAYRFRGPRGALKFRASLETILALVNASGCEVRWHGHAIHTVDDWRKVLDRGLQARGATTRCAREIGRSRSHLYKLRYGPTVPRLFIACLVSRVLFDGSGLTIQVLR